MSTQIGSTQIGPAKTGTTKIRARRASQTKALATAAAIGTAAFALGRWYLRPAQHAMDDSLLDAVLPDAEFSGEVSVVIHAPPRAIFQALREVTLADMPLATFLGELRYLPGRITGKGAAPAPATEPFMQLVMTEGGTILLGEVPDQEVVVGSVGKYHDMLDQQIAPLHNLGEFLHFDQPDYQKLAMSFRVSGSDVTTGYRLTLAHRTHALSPAARWKFALYWLGIKPGGNFVSWLLLRAVKRRAERMEIAQM